MNIYEEMILLLEAADGDEWYTPEWVIEKVNRVLGGIDLDPATTAKANGVVKAKRIYTKRENGLNQPWAGRVYLNPPYSSPGPWVRKLVESPKVSSSILLVNNATETNWFQDVWDKASILCFPNKRIQFWNNPGSSNRYAQAFALFGGDKNKFAKAFQDVGALTTPWRT